MGRAFCIVCNPVVIENKDESRKGDQTCSPEIGLGREQHLGQFVTGISRVDDPDFNKAVGQIGRYHPSNENVGRPNGKRGSAKAERGGPLGGMR
jgi:hypothetical protein